MYHPAFIRILMVIPDSREGEYKIMKASLIQVHFACCEPAQMLTRNTSKGRGLEKFMKDRRVIFVGIRDWA